MKKHIELTEYDNNGRTVIFADSIQGLCRVRDGEYNKEFTEVMVSGYTFIVNEPIDEILESIKALEQSSYNSIKTELNGDTISRQAEPMWIPVSEKLPEEGKEVLTCSNGGFIEIQSFENSHGNIYWENQKGDWTDIDEVIAWMPLPKPYEPQEI